MALNEPVIGQNNAVGASSFYTIQPASGDAYIIMNMWSDQSMEIYMSDGSSDVLVNNASGTPKALALFKYFVNNSNYMKIKNVGSTTASIGYSGMQILD